MATTPRVQHAPGNGDGAESGYVGAADRAGSRHRGDGRILRSACDPNGTQPENGAANQAAISFRKRRRFSAAAGDGMRSRPLLSSDHAPERQRCARAQPYAPGANARRGALVVARAVAQPGGQLAKASKSRRVRANGGPGATGSPGRAWAGDVVLVGVSRLGLRASFLLLRNGFSPRRLPSNWLLSNGVDAGTIAVWLRGMQTYRLRWKQRRCRSLWRALMVRYALMTSSRTRTCRSSVRCV